MPTSRHVLLYGPPAAGKLTVGRCLASGYGLKLLDNTVTIELALRLFEFATKPHVRTPNHPDDLSFDNSDIPPEEVATRIAAVADL